ncbi:NAD-dependent epimerase/dehydratase family protein [Thermodesulforhabdus norvegica]|uniref:UDP-glucuronate 4-epimerase n=1 Tax=Thermodesulforhabdus norvegica TaxID=39841 RepID=A0A1I4V096_9BACT|nr:NAD-dependent epimerase/dehydratase family protein [Thermodesulforhabdus norvegica]SFM94430.1 UDP-glucuronate 4-epimerase [Thermodesulforhabdus norvegica]
MPSILITGAAGFIGFHLAYRFASSSDWKVIALDNINAYYDIGIKLDRLRELGIREILDDQMVSSERFGNLQFIKMDLRDRHKVLRFFQDHQVDVLCHLAAQAGVRHSLACPEDYVSNNISGFLNILDGCRLKGIRKLCFASSSSVYGKNALYPLSENLVTDSPISPYAVTKKCDELLAFCYGHQYGIQTAGLRLFTVYGPWGRPDMALYKFVRNIFSDRPIELYNYGKMKRDFTYIDDCIDAITLIVEKLCSIGDDRFFEIYNVASGRMVDLEYFVSLIEKETGRKAQIIYRPIQAGDVEATFGDISKIRDFVGYEPRVSVEEGIARFVRWYREYHGV